MKKIIELKCPTCGAPLELYDEKCSFCGTAFLIDNDFIETITVDGTRMISCSSNTYRGY